MKHNDGAGATKAKSGKNAQSIVRSAGMSACMSACASSTRSRHKGSSKHNHWEAPSCGWGDDNVRT